MNENSFCNLNFIDNFINLIFLVITRRPIPAVVATPAHSVFQSRLSYCIKL